MIKISTEIPHKIAVAKLCNKLEPDAKFTGAVNWIKYDKNRELIGNNFDGKGFVNGFLSKNHSFENKSVCIFGAGGASVAIASSVADQRIKFLKLINRDIDKAFNLREKLTKKFNFLKVEICPENNYSLNDCDIIINATSLGLKKNDKLPFDVMKSPANSIIADIIMQPEETSLLKLAKSLGRSVHYGKSMIESQIDLAGEFLNLW